MPKLWDTTIEAHREEVRAAVLEAASRLVAEHGLRAVTMSRIAEHAGIGRATLYKYFRHVDAVLDAWHDKQTAGHLEHLSSLAADPAAPDQRLRNVLAAYARQRRMSAQHRDASDIVTALHAGDRMSKHEAALQTLLISLLEAGVADGTLRDDVPPDELALFVMSALDAARHLPSDDAVDRLLDVTLTGLRR